MNVTLQFNVKVDRLKYSYHVNMTHMRLAQLSCCQSAGDLVKFNSGLCVVVFFDYGNTNENINDKTIMYEGYSVIDMDP